MRRPDHLDPLRVIRCDKGREFRERIAHRPCTGFQYPLALAALSADCVLAGCFCFRLADQN
jgi:hypothetical protein